MYIGEASKKSGVTIKAIRFYEATGLIKPPQRSGRYRVYQQQDIELLILIKEAKQFGITLSQLKPFIEYQQGQLNWHKIKIFMLQTRQQLVTRIDDLKTRIEKIDQCCSQINLQP
ncbi:MAG: MerR family transcriptional regulator [Pseudomonadales bacterium]|nr:MerR family transcriptional regulator [Pseudomonadales bacterium]